MTWRRVVMAIGACELALALKVSADVLAFSSDPLPHIASLVTDLLPAIDLAHWIN